MNLLKKKTTKYCDPTKNILSESKTTEDMKKKKI